MNPIFGYPGGTKHTLVSYYDLVVSRFGLSLDNVDFYSIKWRFLFAKWRFLFAEMKISIHKVWQFTDYPFVSARNVSMIEMILCEQII